MLRFLKRMSRQREIYFHEDDYCQQQLLPRDAAAYVNDEVKKIGEFSEAHRSPDGLGWTDVYMLAEAPVEFRTLKIKKELFGKIISSFLPPFDIVYTGYSTHRDQCKKTAAWGTSERSALLADWDDEGIITNAWAEFFEQDEASIYAASKAISSLGRLYPLVYVDWAWGYICDASDEDTFASRLRAKLNTIAENMKSFKKG